jgi:hypothetical protein
MIGAMPPEWRFDKPIQQFGDPKGLSSLRRLSIGDH